MNQERSNRIVGIGLDLVEVERFKEVLSRQGERFIKRVFTTTEQDYCSAKKEPAMFYAARFAAKEAVAKAFRTGIGIELGWLDIEVAHDTEGAPIIQLLGKGMELAKRRGVTEILVSLTHTSTNAAANVILQ